MKNKEKHVYEKPMLVEMSELEQSNTNGGGIIVAVFILVAAVTVVGAAFIAVAGIGFSAGVGYNYLIGNNTVTVNY